MSCLERKYWPTRMMLRLELIAEQEVICTTCSKSVSYEASAVAQKPFDQVTASKNKA